MSRTKQPVRKGRITTIIEEMKAQAARISQAVKAVILVRALLQAATVILAGANALRKAMAGRTIDLKEVEITRTLCPRVLSRIPRSIGMKKSVVSIRKGINALKKI